MERDYDLIEIEDTHPAFDLPDFLQDFLPISVNGNGASARVK